MTRRVCQACHNTGTVGGDACGWCARIAEAEWQIKQATAAARAQRQRAGHCVDPPRLRGRGKEDAGGTGG
jgi:hypothetical protein